MVCSEKQILDLKMSARWFPFGNHPNNWPVYVSSGISRMCSGQNIVRIFMYPMYPIPISVDERAICSHLLMATKGPSINRLSDSREPTSFRI